MTRSDSPAEQPSSHGAGSRPPALWALLAGIAIEVAVLVGAGGLVLVELVLGRSQSVGVSVFLTIFVLGLAWLLVAACRGLLRGQRWGRAPVATWQLLQGVVAVSWLQYEVTVWGGLTLALAVVVLVLLMIPAVVVSTTRDSARPTT
ncbi:hypothetical protein [Oerskovia flava]|uniref:hypothetical protein n=1 Tax=Oerskovia flava TaxID=2986422 RepID=UPI00223F7929|nr:hypothetical protein [Oerskovia sp. JB1-3-2]